MFQDDKFGFTPRDVFHLIGRGDYVVIPETNEKHRDANQIYLQEKYMSLLVNFKKIL